MSRRSVLRRHVAIVEWHVVVERQIARLLDSGSPSRAAAVKEMAQGCDVQPATVTRWLAGFPPEPRARKAAEAWIERSER